MSVEGVVSESFQEVVAPVTETPQEPELKKESDDFSKRFALLSKKEKAILQRDSEISEREKHYQKYKDLEDNKDPLKVLQTYGLTVEQIIDKALAEKDKDTPERKVSSLEEQINELRRERDQEREEAKKAVESQKKREQEEYVQTSIKKVNDEISSQVTNNAEYSLIKEFKAEKTVFDTMLLIVQSNPKAYDTFEDVQKLIPETLKAIEDELAETLSRIKESDKAKKILGLDQVSKPLFPQASIQQKATVPVNTINNKTFNNTANATIPTKSISREESINRAAQLLKELRQKTT